MAINLIGYKTGKVHFGCVGENDSKDAWQEGKQTRWECILIWKVPSISTDIYVQTNAHEHTINKF